MNRWYKNKLVEFPKKNRLVEIHKLAQRIKHWRFKSSRMWCYGNKDCAVLTISKDYSTFVCSPSNCSKLHTKTMQRHIAEDLNLQPYYCENFTSPKKPMTQHPRTEDQHKILRWKQHYNNSQDENWITWNTVELWWDGINNVYTPSLKGHPHRMQNHRKM